MVHTLQGERMVGGRVGGTQRKAAVGVKGLPEEEPPGGV